MSIENRVTEWQTFVKGLTTTIFNPQTARLCMPHVANKALTLPVGKRSGVVLTVEESAIMTGNRSVVLLQCIRNHVKATALASGKSYDDVNNLVGITSTNIPGGADILFIDSTIAEIPAVIELVTNNGAETTRSIQGEFVRDLYEAKVPVNMSEEKARRWI